MFNRWSEKSAKKSGDLLLGLFERNLAELFHEFFEFERSLAGTCTGCFVVLFLLEDSVGTKCLVCLVDGVD